VEEHLVESSFVQVEFANWRHVYAQMLQPL